MVPASAANIRLLIVDDIADNRDILNRRFSRRGFEIVEATNGLAAVRLVDQQNFDLVLLDIMMPGIDGIEVLKTIRTKFSADKLPVVMVTGKSSSMDIVLALELGANDYITKPVDFPIALARVQSHLARKEAQQALERYIHELLQTNRRLEDELAERKHVNAPSNTPTAPLDVVIENIPVPIIVKDTRNCRYEMINKAGETLWGVPRAGIVGKAAHDIFKKDEADRIEVLDAAALHSDQKLMVDEQPVLTLGDGTRLIFTHRVAITAPNGEPKYLLCVMEEFSENGIICAGA